ncbi:hypothetical protein GCM10011320_56740 [Neoroseomonas lacus]|uniref:Uncharacterized protein n=1 Tax=Neoroseomonas lacus TaxID=287609 RepID=A0A917L5Q2_9PROT|nr:hypothetical protein GCM10011320_56740 [Neoroseomonas lacus]
MTVLKAGGTFPNEHDATAGRLVDAMSSCADNEDMGGVLSPVLASFALRQNLTDMFSDPNCCIPPRCP